MTIFKYFIAFLILSGVCISQDDPGNTKALELFIEGKTCELQDNYILAIEKYNQALKLEKSPGIYYTLSKLYYNVSQYQKSLEYGLEAVKIQPENVNYLENIADIYIILNDYKNGLKYLLLVYEKKPHDVNIMYNIGRLYEAEKQPSSAMKYYEKITEDYLYDETVIRRMVEIYESYKDYANSAAAQEKLLSLNPSDSYLKLSIAQTLLKIPDYDNALRVLEEFLQSDPGNRQIQTEVIKIYFRLNKNEIAFEKFGKLIDKDTVDFSAKMGIALAFFDVSQTDSTATDVAKSILQTLHSSYPYEWMPDYYLALIDVREHGFAGSEKKLMEILSKADTSLEAHVLVGFSFYEQNKLAESLDIFIKGSEKFPDDFRLNFLAGNTYYRLGRQRESIPYLEKAKQINPQDLNTLSTLGLLYDNLKMNNECDMLYKEALEYYPDNSLLLNNYAYHLAENDMMLQKAKEMSRKTIDKEPENPSYLDTYGWILFKLKEYKDAARYIEKAVKLNGNAVLYEHLGDIYEAMGEVVKALKNWKQAESLDPDNKELKKKIEKYK
jgi:tetratricopeptide (TPR) repeat protein